MPKITIYTTLFCPYCHRAKRLLQQKGAAFEEIDVTGDWEARDRLTEKAGRPHHRAADLDRRDARGRVGRACRARARGQARRAAGGAPPGGRARAMTHAAAPPSPATCGDTVGVRGGDRRRSKRPPLTPKPSPRRRGEGTRARARGSRDLGDLAGLQAELDAHGALGEHAHRFDARLLGAGRRAAARRWRPRPCCAPPRGIAWCRRGR